MASMVMKPIPQTGQVSSMFGVSTLFRTWIIPLSVMMSLLVMLAALIFGFMWRCHLCASIITAWPWTVSAVFIWPISSTVSFPATTWYIRIASALVSSLEVLQLCLVEVWQKLHHQAQKPWTVLCSLVCQLVLGLNCCDKRLERASRNSSFNNIAHSFLPWQTILWFEYNIMWLQQHNHNTIFSFILSFA